MKLNHPGLPKPSSQQTLLITTTFTIWELFINNFLKCSGISCSTSKVTSDKVTSATVMHLFLLSLSVWPQLSRRALLNSPRNAEVVKLTTPFI